MARPERHDVDYFPFYVKDGRTLFIIEGKFGALGTGIFTNLFRFLSRTPDHNFQVITESDEMYLFTNLKCDPEIGREIIQMMVTTGKLDRDLWEQKRVIASKDFLESVSDAYKRRSNNCPTIEGLCAFYGVNVYVNPDNVCNNPQTKVKETILKDTKGKKELTYSGDRYLQEGEDEEDQPTDLSYWNGSGKYRPADV
jgi:hypothetical protein